MNQLLAKTLMAVTPNSCSWFSRDSTVASADFLGQKAAAGHIPQDMDMCAAIF